MKNDDWKLVLLSQIDFFVYMYVNARCYDIK